MLTTQPIRYSAPDTLRGLALINMIVYHALWDIVHIFGIDINWYTNLPGFVWQQAICWMFILLSGFCHGLGGKRLKRALTVLICSALISAITIIFLPYQAIRFGILTLIGSCMLFAVPLDKFLQRLKPSTSLIICIIFFVLSRNVNSGFFGFGTWNIASVPRIFYTDLLTAYLGFPPADFFSTDYFSILPWVFLFFAGYFICRCLKAHNRLTCLNRLHFWPLEFLGRHSLIIYLVHQPIIYGVLMLIFKII